MYVYYIMTDTVYVEIFEWLNFQKSQLSAISKTIFSKIEQEFS